MKDVFICHASEDKPGVVEPLVAAFKQANISYWYDKAEIKWGDSITKKVNEGLRISHFVIVVISKAFLSKNFPQSELYSMLSREISSGEVKILPLIVKSNDEEKREILESLSLMQDKLYLTWDNNPNKIIDALQSHLSDQDNTQDNKKLETPKKDTQLNKEASATQDLQSASPSPSSTLETSYQGVEMQNINWLHLSDWHQQGKELIKDRERLLTALIKDIREREKINPDLAKIDFIIFSGDIAKSGQQEQYEAAKQYLFEPLLKATEVSPERLFIVPGNHDLDEGKFKYLPGELNKPVQSIKTIEEWLEKEEDRNYLLKPFEAYKEFVTTYTGQENPDYASIRQLEINGKKISLLGLNSALMCRRYKDPNNNNEVRDQGRLIVGQCQIEDAIEKTPDSYMRIAVQHHPFKWIDEQEEFRIKQLLGQNCQFILFGHEHIGQCEKTEGTNGDFVIIPAGASYDTIGYKNAYNFVNLNFEKGKGTVYFRRWDNENRVFVEDIGKYRDPKSGRYTGEMPFSLPKS